MVKFEVGDKVLILNYWPGVVAEVVPHIRYSGNNSIWVGWGQDRIPVEFEPQDLLPIPKNATPAQVEVLKLLYG